MGVEMISFVTHARNQPGIVAEHLRVWDAMPEGLRDQWEFVLIDDCSDPPVSERRDYLTVLRSLDPMEWNYGVKNLGAREARHDWLLLTNVDHVLTTEAAIKIIGLQPSPGQVYRFARHNPDPGAEARYSQRRHIGTLLVHRRDLFAVGGYDEDFSGHYGHDDTFLAHCFRQQGYGEFVCDDIVLRNHSGSIVVPDADFLMKPEWSRDLTRNERLLARKRRGRPVASQPTVRFPWERVA